MIIMINLDEASFGVLDPKGNKLKMENCTIYIPDKIVIVISDAGHTSLMPANTNEAGILSRLAPISPGQRNLRALNNRRSLS